MSEFEERVAGFKRRAAEVGVNRFNASPPLLRLLWALGFEVRPFCFWPAWAVTAVLGGFFGIGMGVALSAINPLVPKVLGTALWVGALAAGSLFFGGGMAAYYSWLRKRLQPFTW